MYISCFSGNVAELAIMISKFGQEIEQHRPPCGGPGQSDAIITPSFVRGCLPPFERMWRASCRFSFVPGLERR
jgi:hypothetical protein